MSILLQNWYPEVFRQLQSPSLVAEVDSRFVALLGASDWTTTWIERTELAYLLSL